MLIQRFPLRYLSRVRRMTPKTLKSDSTMNLSAILDSRAKVLRVKTNPMDIRAMLNPSRASRKYPATKSRGRHDPTSFPDSPKSESGEQQFYLPSMKVGASCARQSSIPTCLSLRTGNPSPPLSPQSDCFNTCLHPYIISGYPTPPPSSPQHRGLNQPENGSNYMTGPQDPHHLSWEHTNPPPQDIVVMKNSEREMLTGTCPFMCTISTSLTRPPTTPTRVSRHLSASQQPRH